MRKIISRLAVGLALLLFLLIAIEPVAGSPFQQLETCREIAFSTSEDFVTQGPVPPGGNIISDGDLLGENCSICARNSELLVEFDVNNDLGLDAVDVIEIESSLVAFSTELDSPNSGQFTEGDLLFTNGAVIPNMALTYAFGQGAITYDLGLDAVHFVGKIESINAFVIDAAQYKREYWLENPAALKGMLEEYAVDVWFSTEGTWSNENGTLFLDGDLLSAKKGLVEVANKELLPVSVPAGLPDRGVDFGLDAATGDRGIEAQNIHFSTEILFRNETSFTDGDVLKQTNGVVHKNSDLIVCFEPMANFVGLDALYMNVRGFRVYLPLVINSSQSSLDWSE